MSFIKEGSTATTAFELFRNAEEKEQAMISDEAKEVLSGTQYKKFKTLVKENEKMIAELAKGERKEEIENDSEEDVPITTPGTTESGHEDRKKKAKKVRMEITTGEMLDFWRELEKSDMAMLVEASVIADFQYVGFSPDAILKSILSRSRAAGKSTSGTMKDISTMCTIAIMKGSITDHNLKKMSDSGKRTYGKLEEMYDLKRGGSKGVDPEVITIARVGAAFPGAMMQILLSRPELTKKFSGPFGSKALPSSLRHQCAAACIPDTLDSKVKEFILGLITAYTADQSKTISKSKDKADELFERQENFIAQTQSSSYPSEEVRKTIFKKMNLTSNFDNLLSVANNIKKVVPSFELVSKEDFEKAVSGV